RVRHALVDRDHHFRRGAPADLRLDVLGADFHHGVEHRVGVGDQGLPQGHGGIPVGALRRVGTVLHVLDGLLVHCHHADAGAGLDGHVADGHAAFHGQVADGAAGKFPGMTVAARGADPAEHGQHDVLAVTPTGSLPSTRTCMFFIFLATRHWVASTCSTSEVPMPWASAPKAPWVEVCESPQTTVMPGRVAPCSGPTTWTMP